MKEIIDYYVSLYKGAKTKHIAREESNFVDTKQEINYISLSQGIVNNNYHYKLYVQKKFDKIEIPDK